MHILNYLKRTKSKPKADGREQFVEIELVAVNVGANLPKFTGNRSLKIAVVLIEMGDRQLAEK